MKENKTSTEFIDNIINTRDEKANELKAQLGCDDMTWVISSPVYFALKGGKWGLVSPTGEWLVPCVMDEFYNCPEQIQEVIPLKKDGKWGFFTLDGLFVEPQFDDFTDEGDDIVSVKLGDQWGWLDDDGHFLTKEEADARDILPLSWWLQDTHPRYEE